MLVAPLPVDPDLLAILVMHESWHRIQQRIGLPPAGPNEDQLDTQDGRIALRLELRALATALAAPDRAKTLAALADALAARRWRQERFPGSMQREDALERHEGVAEYTGRVLARDPAMVAHMVQRLQEGDHMDTYARTFAYFTGPAYGMLLDRLVPGWRRSWNKQTGLAPLLAQRVGLSDSAPAMLDDIHGHYDLAAIRLEEQARAARAHAQFEALRTRLVTGPVLTVKLNGASFAFNPSKVMLLPPYGSAYGSIRVGTDWGVLTVTKGALLSDSDCLSVSLAGARATVDGMIGDGWVLVLEPGWRLAPGIRAQDLTIVGMTGARSGKG